MYTAPKMDLRERANNHRRHPWELSRAEFFSNLILAQKATSPVRVLDVGAGDSFFAETLLGRLPAGSSVTCVDPGYPNEWLGERELADGRRLLLRHESPNELYDWIVLLDVLEHVEEDGTLLRDLTPRLSPNGQFLISVPAYQWLYTDHDTQLGHVRRYAPSALIERLRESGLRAQLRGGLFCSLVLPRSLSKLGELLRGHRAAPNQNMAAHIATSVGQWSQGPLVTGAILGVLRWDSAVCLWLAQKSLSLPSLSTWAVAGKEP